MGSRAEGWKVCRCELRPQLWPTAATPDRPSVHLSMRPASSTTPPGTGVPRFPFCTGSQARFCPGDTHVLSGRLRSKRPSFSRSIWRQTLGQVGSLLPLLAGTCPHPLTAAGFLEVPHRSRGVSENHPFWNLLADLQQ